MKHARFQQAAGSILIGSGIIVAALLLASRWYELRSPGPFGSDIFVESGQVMLSNFWRSGSDVDTGRFGVFRLDHPDLQWARFTDGSESEYLIDTRLLSVREAGMSNSVSPKRLWFIEFMLWPIAMGTFVPGVVLVQWGRRARHNLRVGPCSAFGNDTPEPAALATRPEGG